MNTEVKQIKYPALIYGAAAAFFFFIAGCAGPVDENAPDYTEFESVWQYLRVYSIYQDRVPDDPFVFSRPESLMLAIADTLKGAHYTGYDYGYTVISASTGTLPIPETVGETPAAVAISFGATGSVAALEIRKTVFFDSLTDSTALLTIDGFTEGEVVYNSQGTPVFQYDWTSETFKELLSKVSQFPIIILDLRSNGGGIIDEATTIVDAFLPVNTGYIQARERVYFSDKRTDSTLDWHPWVTEETASYALRINGKSKKVVILMDSLSASASEILIAALKDGIGATLVGKKTYGKGIGQIRLLRRDRDPIKITFLQLKGISDRTGDYHHIGIEPDIPASGSNEEWLLTAVQVHEPGVSRLRSLRKEVSSAASYQPAGYRIVYEE